MVVGVWLGPGEGRGDGDPVDRLWWVGLGAGDEAAGCAIISAGEGPGSAAWPLSTGPACGTPFRGAARRAAGLPGGWVAAGCAMIAFSVGGSDSRDPVGEPGTSMTATAAAASPLVTASQT
ncbi:MAG TPA: hypothetical protein VE343_13020, partial [Streptosporangiaceae bacterium]|nr:hypothetical protein [Streptosporangiaceae bacterium]